MNKVCPKCGGCKIAKATFDNGSGSFEICMDCKSVIDQVETVEVPNEVMLRDITHEHLLRKGWTYIGSGPLGFALYQLEIHDFENDYTFQIIYTQGAVTGLTCEYKDLVSGLKGGKGLKGEIYITNMEHLYREIRNIARYC